MPGRNSHGGALLSVAGNLHGCTMCTDQCLKERIAGETVGPVEPGTGHLSYCIQSRYIGFPVHIGQDSTTLIMSRRHYGNWLPRDINAVAQTCFVNIRESLANEI